MFRYDQFLYEASSKDLLKCHQDSFHQEEKYNCNICGIQVSRNDNLIQHKRAVHEGVKYPCGQCSYQATTKGSLAGLGWMNWD